MSRGYIRIIRLTHVRASDPMDPWKFLAIDLMPWEMGFSASR